VLRSLPPAKASCPLLSLTAAVIDTETTSLDVKSARIIEIGAVPLIEGVLAEDQSFQRFVNPDLPIPADSREVHGIGDSDVKDAPRFADAYHAYSQFAGNQLMVGYSLGFDLGVLKHEHQRSGLPFAKPRALDVRELVALVDPHLPDHALETVAAWLKVPVTDRHRAVGDAVLTGKVLLALLPALRQIGIRTLGEAEEACRRKVSKGQEAPPSGWQEAVQQAAVGSAAPSSALSRIDSFPYRHRIGDVMNAPPITISSDASVWQAMQLLAKRRISSAFVEPGNSADSWGIVTERDVLRKVAAEGRKAFDAPVNSIASRPLQTVPVDEFIYRAIGRMRRQAFRHLGVVDQAGKLCGALSQRDLLSQRGIDAIAMTDALSENTSIAGLAAVWRTLSSVAQSLVDEDVNARDIAAIISTEVCSLTARAAQMAYRETAAEKKPPHDLRFAVMVLGSGGRGESLLAMDQDNAIVFNDTGDLEAASLWLETMATRMNAILDAVGIPFCKGGVMAKNAAWRMSETQWRNHISRWLSRNAPEDVLNADIFFDALPVYGDHQLADRLRQDAIQAASESSAFLKLLSLNSRNTQLLIGWFGRWKLNEAGRMDLKAGGLMPIFSAARTLALKHNILERSTLGRLSALAGKADVPGRQRTNLIEAHLVLMDTILRQQLQDISRGIPPGSLVDPKLFNATEQDRLKWALENVKSTPDLLGDPVG
jgi:DNA polymerase-3 subunit epsilon/CBS domain-containing protein